MFFYSKVVIYKPKHMHSKFEEKELVFDGEAKTSDLKQWVNDNV